MDKNTSAPTLFGQKEIELGKTLFTVSFFFSDKGKSLKDLVEKDLILNSQKSYQKTA